MVVWHPLREFQATGLAAAVAAAGWLAAAQSAAAELVARVAMVELVDEVAILGVAVGTVGRWTAGAAGALDSDLDLVERAGAEASGVHRPGRWAGRLGVLAVD